MRKAVNGYLRWWSAVSALGLLGGCEGPLDQEGVIEAEQQALTAGAVPARIKVMPAFLVPQGQPTPTTTDKNLLRDHVAMAQARYKVMLKNRDTFEIAGSPVVVTSTKDVNGWTNVAGGEVHKAMLDHFGYDRFNNPYIYVVVPVGVPGTPWAEAMNGGLNSGGGSAFLLGNWAKDKKDGFQTALKTGAFQSMLQHELAHSFGLVHSHDSPYPQGSSSCASDPKTWATPCKPFPTPLECRFSAWQGWSVTSYDQCLNSSGMTPSATPGILLPEEIAALALNRRVFPNLYFDPETDLTPGTTGVYRMGDNPNTYPIPGQYDALLTVTTTSGEAFGSKVANIARNPIQRTPTRAVSIRKSNPTVGWDEYSMWHSAQTSTGWVSVEVQFPRSVSLKAIGVHTEHSGAHWAADSVKISATAGRPPYNPVAQVDNLAVDDVASFPTTTAAGWKFEFHARSGAGGYVVVRGLQFFTADGEIFPSFYPTEQFNYPKVTTTSGEGYGSKVSHAVTGWSAPPNDAQWGYDPSLMWHSNYSSTGWVSLQVTFPYPVTIDGLEVHSQYGGQAHLASKVQVEYDKSGTFTSLTSQNTGADATLWFTKVKARRFQVKLYSTSGYVVLRQLLFKSPLNNGYLERPDCIDGPEVLPPY